MLYPVELQSRCLHDLAVNRGAKIDRLSSRPNTPSKNSQKKKSAPAESLALPLGLRLADADPPGSSLTARGRSIPLPGPRNQQRLRVAAGPPGKSLTAQSTDRSLRRLARVVQHHLAGPPFDSQAPSPSLRRSKHSACAERVGCSRSTREPQWVLALWSFNTPLSRCVCRNPVSRVPKDALLWPLPMCLCPWTTRFS